MSKKQKYAEILDDPDAIQCIREWVSEHKNGFNSVISANELSQRLGDPELKRELVILRDICFDDDASFSEGVKKGLKKKGVRKKLLPTLAAMVFGRDPSDVFNRLMNFPDFERMLRGVSAPVEVMANTFSSENSSFESQTDALFGAMDALFATLEKMDLERKLIILRIVCVLHLTFIWSAQVDAGSEITERVGRRFYDYLGLPDSERSLNRLRSGVAIVVSRILTDTQPFSVLIPEFEQWFRSLFLEIDMRGAELLMKHNRELRQLPGNPFCLTDDCDDPGEQEDVGEENEGEPITEDAAEDPLLAECPETGGAVQEVEAADPIDCATHEAELLFEAPPTQRSKELRKYFSNLTAHVTPLEYDNYKDLPVAELREFMIEAQVVEEKIGGIRSMLVDEIRRRESLVDDSEVDV